MTWCGSATASKFATLARLRRLLCGAALALTTNNVAHADPASISVSADQPLRFGTFVVPAAGSRSITAEGMVTSNGILSIGSDPVGPAQFTITYDRGSESPRSISILVQVFLSGGQPITVQSVTGSLSSFDTDLPGTTSLAPGVPAIFTIADCTQRQCRQTFHVGARLDVTRSSAGASLIIPLPVTASVLAVL